MNPLPTHNPEFVGIQALKQKHAAQLKQFEQWAEARDWLAFLHHHYDWWMFPISRTSLGQGAQYTVYRQEIESLKNDREFMENYRRGVKLLTLSWGWDIDQQKPVNNPDPDQKWNHYEVRLGKMADSLKLFGEIELFKSLRQYFLSLPASEQPKEEWARAHLKL